MLDAKTVEIDTILPVCVKFCASHNSKIKRGACEALICCSEKYSRPDVGILKGEIEPQHSFRYDSISNPCSDTLQDMRLEVGPSACLR